MATTYEGNIDENHNTDGTRHQAGQTSEHMCPQTWARVTFTEGPGATILGDEAILAKCPNPRCQATDLKVVMVKAIS